MGRSIIALAVLLACSLALNVYELYSSAHRATSFAADDIVINRDETLLGIERYLDAISPDYIAAVQSLARQNGVPSWGCGPSSYALATLINRKFFQNKLTIDASYNNQPYEIVERFGFVKEKTYTVNYGVTDHAWLELYLRDKFIFIDPTIAQFGKYHSIAYEVFSVGDPTITQTLNSTYSIMDVRFRILMQKVIDRIPAEQEPYPGATINSSSMPYYLQVLQARNVLDSGLEPPQWKDWVDSILKEFT